MRWHAPVAVAIEGFEDGCGELFVRGAVLGHDLNELGLRDQSIFTLLRFEGLERQLHLVLWNCWCRPR